tara:strand:- start:571 stop:1533 length:963 start_codon:yes stop_codon:yes gene_type:complete
MKLKKRNKIFIIGSGVIGAYLSKLLIKKKFEVIVTSRKKRGYESNYRKLGVKNKVKFIKLDVLNKQNIKSLIFKFNPKAIYYLAGQSSVPASFKMRLETFRSNYLGAANFLSILKEENLKTKFIKANSAYIFNGSKKKITITSKLAKPESPYTNSQIKAFKIVKKFRKKHNVKCYSAIFFNIESDLRSKKFITKKVCILAKNIKQKKIKKMYVGNINTIRDFSWAPEIVKALYLMMYLKPCDLLIGTGKSMKIKNVIKYAFEYWKLNYKNYISIDQNLIRKKERNKIVGSMSNTFKKLKKWNWKPKIYGKKLIYKMARNS